ncbi:MAG: c-type cytochrome domain-containing protein [Cyclobacteriaceae bacterium]
MRSNYKIIAERTLFFLNVLLLYFLILEKYIEIPFWLQPLGRLHPMILHFPIALLYLAMVLEFFRFRKEFRMEGFYQTFLTHLFLFSVITAGMAALMGLFLSLEEGYGGPALNWHKWSGASIVFLASIMYFIREKKWYRQNLARGGASIMGLTIILAGHFGAALTHGEDFIFGPILQARIINVPIEEAVVFDHLVMPILEKKCNSCHNESKAKGELIMTDRESILKGGKSGKLFEPGDIHQSLMIERLSLPMEEEEHMPPSGKPQLTKEEKLLLELWIQNKADFEMRVLALPENDSLRLISTNLLNPTPEEKVYDFDMPDVNLLKSLNNEYRVIRPLSKDSPALDVTLFNANAYSEEMIKELEVIKEQIVFLSLSKIPIGNEELKTVGQFENLERLNLNFSEITGDGLVELYTLKNLEHLSLSGTQIRTEDLRTHLNNLQSLQTITVWNTPVNTEDLDALRNEFKQIQIVAGREGLDDHKIKLNIPMLKNQSTIFYDSLELDMGHPIENVTLRYALDGSEPDSLESPVFEKGDIWVNRTTVINVKAFKEGWYGSPTATFRFYQNKFPPDSVALITRLNRVHPADGSATFFDGQFGGFNANSPAWANNWAGFSKEDMELYMEYDEAVEVSSVGMNVLVEPETIIFPPIEVEIWGGNSKDDMNLLGKMMPELPQEESKPYIQLVTANMDPVKVKCLVVIGKTVKELPSWHRNKGRSALLLIDEMFVN